MKKLLLFSIIGILLIGIISAGTLVAYDSYKEKTISKEDIAVLKRANFTDFPLIRNDLKNYIAIGFKKNNYAPFDIGGIINKTNKEGKLKTEEEIQKEITTLENLYLSKQIKQQLTKESLATKAPTTQTTTLVTFKEGKAEEVIIK